MSHYVDGSVTLIAWSLDHKVKVTGQVLYFLVNESAPPPLNVATSSFVGA